MIALMLVRMKKHKIPLPSNPPYFTTQLSFFFLIYNILLLLVFGILLTPLARGVHVVRLRMFYMRVSYVRNEQADSISEEYNNMSVLRWVPTDAASCMAT